MPKLSPLRMFSSKPEPTENEAAAGSRLPFCPIQETSGFDPTPRASRGSKAQQVIIPLLEKNVAPDMTPEKRSLAPKSKFLWYQHQQVRNHPPCNLSQDDAGSDTSEISEHNTPSRSLRHHHSLQQVVKHGGASQFSTPRASKIENKYLNLHSEPGNNTLQPSTGTPKKSVSRSLKYNQDMSVRVAAAKSHGKHGDAEFDLEEDASFWQDHNVQVLVRIRPASSTEVSHQGPARCLRQDTPHSVSWTGHPESRFTFDHVAGETISQEKLFRVSGLPMVENCVSGYNNCIFAYGQTGSGKTHTMLGDIVDLDQEQTEGRGMIPRVFEYLFVKIQLEEEARRCERLEFVCKCSFLEIYNEQISDLLEPSSTNLQLREDAKKGVYVENLTEVEVRSVKDVIKLLLQGSANRKVAATNMNRESSRSHSVFTCVVESKWESDSVINTRFGRLNLVDLAGSERQKSSGAEGDRLKEAANINKSLSTLGLVIMVLVDAANGKPRHVPYRDSKLTFLLQDSLGGNSKTLIIATVSPSSSCSLETLSTLKFAQRAKFIRNNPIINEDSFGDVVSLRQQIQQLKEELSRFQSQERKEGHDGDSNMGFLAQDVLAASLRREAVAESVIKSLGSEIGHLKRLVRQREEDTQRVKMLLRFREDRIRRMEAASKGVLGAIDYASEERAALQDEVKLLANRIEHNPEVTRFAMENIRLVEELKRFQEFYDHGEREIMCAEISNLRDQVVEVLEANRRLKDCGVPSHSELELENEKLRLEACKFQKSIEDSDHRLHALQDANDKLIRQNQELQQQLSVLLGTSDGLRRELETTKARVEDLKTDQQAHLTTIAGLKVLVQQSEEKKAVEVQMQVNSADASQQVGFVKDPLQSLQLELQKKNEVDYLEKQLKTAAENYDEAQKMKVEQELLKTRQELENAQELNRIFYREKVRRLSLETRMEAIRAEVESETADALASMHRDLAMTNEMLNLATEHEREATENVARLAYEVSSLQLENTRLADICNSVDKEKACETEVNKLWQQATRRLVDCLSEGDETLNAAAREMEDILRVHLTDPLSNQAAIELFKKQKATEELQMKLQQAFGIVKDAEEKMRALNEATYALTELQKKQKAETERQIQDANSRVGDVTRTMSEQQTTISTLQERNLADLQLLEETQASLQAAQKELTEQEKRNSSYVVRLAELTEELEEVKNCFRRKEKQLVRDVEDLKNKYDKVVAEYALTCSTFSDHIVILDHEARSFKDSLEHTLWTSSCDTVAVLDDLKGGILEVRNFTPGLMEDLSESNTRLEELSRRLETSQHNLTSVEARYQHFVERASSAERELFTTRAELDTALATQTTYASDIAVIKQQFEAFREVADSERQSLQLMIEDTQERLSSAESKAAEWQLELDRSHEKYELVKKECMTAVAEMNELDIKVQQLDEHIGLLEEENSVLKRESVAAKAIIEGLKAETDTVRIELQSKVASLSDEVRRKDECQQALEHSFQQLVSTTTKLQEDAEEKISSLHWEIDMKEKQVHEELSRVHDILGSVNSDVNTIEASLLEENALLESNVRFLESEREAQCNVIANLHREQTDLRDEIEQQKVVIYNMNRQAQHGTEDQAALEGKVASLLAEIEKKEDVIKGLEFDMGLLQESFADATSKIVEAQESRSRLEEELSSKLDELAQVKVVLTDVRMELLESTNSIQAMEIDLVALRDSKSMLSEENIMLTDKIQQLELEKNNIQGELEEKAYLVESLDQELLELSSLVEQKIGEAIGSLNQELHLVVKERDQLNAELLVVTEQLEMAQSLADEREVVATEARQVAEVSKAQAEDKDEEIKVLERSVGELESIVNALENQVAVIKREAQMQRLMREDLETEVQSLKYEISLRSESTEMKLTEGEAVLHLKEEVTKLGEDCSEKDAQIHAYKNHISDLMAASSKQGVQYRQKITELETLLEQLKSAKVKGSSSPFKCIGLGLSQQINSEIDEELSAARTRIGDLENIAANRQREVFMLNARLAEAESMTHDVVRDLLGVKMDIATYASLHACQDASSIKAEEEISRLRKQVEAYIEERESCLEEINHRQGDIVAIRVATEKLRRREETLAIENEKLKDDLNAFKKHQIELESEVRKLSGQQNLQQRIHHHAKIKEENNCLKMKNEELSTKLRHMEARLCRVTDELARCRNTDGDIPDEEDS